MQARFRANAAEPVQATPPVSSKSAERAKLRSNGAGPVCVNCKTKKGKPRRPGLLRSVAEPGLAPSASGRANTEPKHAMPSGSNGRPEAPWLRKKTAESRLA